MKNSQSTQLIQDVATRQRARVSVMERKKPVVARAVIQPSLNKNRAKAKPARKLAAFSLQNYLKEEEELERIEESKELIVDIDEDVLEDVSHAVSHPRPHRARDLKEAPLKTISEHIGELRKRALYCVLALIFGGTVGYFLQARIIRWLTKPLGEKLFYTSPTGGFDFLIKICIFFGLLLAIPIIIFNIIRFISPALPKHVTYSTGKVLLIALCLALAGVSFAYYVSLPAALHFLNGFSNKDIESLISAQEYFNFVMIYIAGFAALFQMPLLIAFINKVAPLTPASMFKKQRVIILVSFIVAAVLTPTPDPINQFLMAMPIIVLYQLSIGIVWRENRKRKHRTKQFGQIAEPLGI